MSRSWGLFLQDMLEASRKVVRYTSGLDLDGFVGDEILFDATLRNLEVLGEATRGIPDEIRDRHPDVDWRGITSLRNVLAHAYFALDNATLWKIIATDIPRLIPRLERIQREQP